ncbi:hypothetical protein ACOMCU_16230 [Lysinibacillus sp. UGB7]|uniref:hypothetical protein n=1 Tax=Lysinibacillus sp. UGB7 TaxID=3411039 RepID=UPI003B78EA6A
MKFKYLLVVLMVALLTGCVREYKSTTVEAVVIEKDYDAPKTTSKRVMQDGKYVTKTTNHRAEYDVTIEYNGIEEEFDSRSLYDKVKEGQKIKVTYKKGYDKDGNLVAEHLQLIDK